MKSRDSMPSVMEPNPDWIFEPKWDGYRAICYFGESVKFISRRRNDLTTRFLELQAIQVKAASALIDGEIVATDDEGLPCFDELRKKRRSCAVVFYAFDILELNGEDLTGLPLLKRKTALKRILPRTKTNRIRFTDYVISEGLALFAELDEKNLEGMVAKKLDSQYAGGRSKDWLKIKTQAGKEEIRKRIETW
jgi:bifunctional non-homologous end joining protein LigD